ncbi:DUF6572 domain-containing protein [Pasteurella atlantica]|uniref:DUF6572 domain-containing protein n=1 Tax=Pasteurellaceae TaxID=712 RepID=UPI00274797C0|nr:DUF6572 domain-containing protein [Pasteurella atlantica]MDP8100096.1 hypothetical protein [Pasteurella atlantica]MDP8106223.1 hypothetical protein [Pasteurella atlantica]MDP8115952.1 hypothetical protein [Pasteurella atlantica]
MNKKKVVIDFIGTDSQTKRTTLLISDSLEFDETNEHLVWLQEKLNSYLDSIKSKTLESLYPHIKESLGYTIEIYFKYEPNDESIKFLKLVKNFLQDKDIEFSYKVL